MMKKTLYLTAAVLAFAGCAKESVNETTASMPAFGKTVRFTATLADEGLKSTYDKTDGFAWTAGESVSVGTSEGSYAAFSCTDAENGVFSRTFSGDAPTLLLAVSPAQGGSFTSAADYQVSLPGEYTYAEGVTNALMIGTPDGSTNGESRFSFRHAAGLLKVTYKNVPVGTEKFHLETDAAITGTFTLNGVSANDIEISKDAAALAGGSKGVDIVLSSATAVEQDMTFYVPVPTGTYSSISMDLGQDFTAKTLSGNLTVKRGEVFELPTVTLASGFQPITVGATDCSSGWGDDVRSPAVELAAGQVLHCEFINHSSKAGIWNNWNLMVTTDGNTEIFVNRTDNWGWGNGDYDASRMNTTIEGAAWDDALFMNIMDGAYVNLTLERSFDGILFVKAKATHSGVGTIYKTYSQPAVAGQSVYAALKCDGSYFEIKKLWLSNSTKQVTGYASAYDYYIYDTALELNVVGSPKRINKVYNDGTTYPLNGSAFTFAGGNIEAQAGNQVFNAVYQGENVRVTIPVKVGTGAFGSTTLVTSGLAYSPFFGELSAGQSASKKLFVYSSCVNNWASPCADCAAAGFASFYCSLRMDNFGWGDYYSTATATSNWNWDKFLDYQNHDTVTMTWTANNANQGTMRFDVTYWDGETHFQEFANFYINQTLAYRSFTENSYAVVIE